MSNKDKRLVILTPAFPANESEVNWVHSLQLFLHSVKRLFPEIEIIVLSFIYPHSISNYQWNGVEIFSFDGMNFRKYKRPLLWGKIWKKLSEINKQQKITAMLSIWCSECALVGKYFGKRNSIKHFTWICGQDARKKNKMVKFIRPLPTELIAKSDFLVDEFYRNHHIKPAYVIPNGIDLSMYGLSSEEKNIDIMGAGSLSFLKQYDIFVEIIAKLKTNMPRIKAVLCGDGEHEEEIKKICEELSLQQNLILTGMLTPAESIKLMQRAKIFLHPSSYEGFSMACLEALYAGAHVISFIKPMYDEIKNWHVVTSKEEMHQKAVELLNDPRLNHEKVFTYSMDDSAASMMELFGLAD
jgi:glycosyltransferase involved in cell wall biosynthesis